MPARPSAIRFPNLLWAVTVGGLVATTAWGQQFNVRTLTEGLQGPQGVAIHPNGDVYVSEMDAGRIVVLRNNRPEPALAPGWTVSEELPRWAISDRVPHATWMSATLQKPGSITISTNGTLYVAEQIPNGRILEFAPDDEGRYSQAKAIPVPWLDQEFQWYNLYIDALDRLFVVGSDQVGSDFMRFGSALVRQPDGDWWVIDFGPFADFYTFVVSARQDVMILGDRRRGGALSWWEVDRHIMLGGVPNSTGRAELRALALYPDGAFVIGQQDAPGRASLKRMDPFSGQQVVLTEALQSIGAIAIDRENSRYYVTDPAAGRLLECTPSPPMRFNEAAMRQIVRSIDGMTGFVSEAPAFLTSFFDRLMSAAQDILPDDSTHAVQFNLSDLAGRMPVIAGRVRAAIEVEGAEEDPLEEIEFFLLFPSMVVMTDESVTPSMSFFSARRRSGAVEQTRPLFKDNVQVMRLSGTNISRVASAPGGVHIPIVVCGMAQDDGGIHVNLSFLGAGIYGDYYLTLFQGPREQTAKLTVQSPYTETGTITYEASFIDEALIEGMDGSVTREQLSNLLISGFEGGGGADRAVGWMRLGQFPASLTVAFGDEVDTTLTGAQSDMRDIIQMRALEMRMETAADIEALEDGVMPAPDADDAPPAAIEPAEPGEETAS